MVAIQGEAGLGKSTRLAATEEPSGDGWSTVKSAGSAIEADLRSPARSNWVAPCARPIV